MSVAVIMTCYNEGAYIEAAVQSVLGQTRADAIDRIVIADDGSAPETVEVLHRVETLDPRIEVIYGPGGAGLPRNRNLAADRCSSEFLAILDGDDFWTPEKLATQLPLIAADDTVALVYSDFYAFADGHPDSARLVRAKDITRTADVTKTYFLNDPPIIPSTIIIRRSAFERVGGFDPSIRVFEDTDFYLRVSRAGRFALASTPLLYKRFRTSSLTGQRSVLMAHHAFVALKFAATEPRLLPLVCRRLSERARKLGNLEYYDGRTSSAASFFSLAVQTNSLNAAAWGGLFLSWFGSLGRRLLEPVFASRAAAYRTQ